jgi:hypothetical protein
MDAAYMTACVNTLTFEIVWVQRLVSADQSVTGRQRLGTAVKERVEELRRARISLGSVQVVLGYKIHLRLSTWNT